MKNNYTLYLLQEEKAELMREIMLRVNQSMYDRGNLSYDVYRQAREIFAHEAGQYINDLYQTECTIYNVKQQKQESCLSKKGDFYESVRNQKRTCRWKNGI